MSAGKKSIEKNELFYLKVFNFLDKILYCICKYFIMWDVQSQEKKWSEKWMFVTGCKKIIGTKNCPKKGHMQCSTPCPGSVILKFLYSETKKHFPIKVMHKIAT